MSKYGNDAVLTIEKNWEEAEANADRLFKKIKGMLVKAGVPVKDVNKIMLAVAEYGNAEIEAESYCEQ